MEMLGVKGLAPDILKIRMALIENCYVVTFNSDIKEIAIRLKQQIMLKLPDAIVAASALFMGLPLVSADKALRKIPGLELRLLKL
jgi:predicted nucleic acid-binding protein